MSSVNGISDLTHSEHRIYEADTGCNCDYLASVSTEYRPPPRHGRRGKIMHCEILVVQILETLDFVLGISLLIF